MMSSYVNHRLFLFFFLTKGEGFAVRNWGRIGYFVPGYGIEDIAVGQVGAACTNEDKSATSIGVCGQEGRDEMNAETLLATLNRKKVFHRRLAPDPRCLFPR
jgi:hypothetical protein